VDHAARNACYNGAQLPSGRTLGVGLIQEKVCTFSRNDNVFQRYDTVLKRQYHTHAPQETYFILKRPSIPAVQRNITTGSANKCAQPFSEIGEKNERTKCFSLRAMGRDEPSNPESCNKTKEPKSTKNQSRRLCLGRVGVCRLWLGRWFILMTKGVKNVLLFTLFYFKVTEFTMFWNKIVILIWKRKGLRWQKKICWEESVGKELWERTFWERSRNLG
jgi:hypothetical protein